jgi:hypothetical protein
MTPGLIPDLTLDLTMNLGLEHQVRTSRSFSRSGGIS